MKKLLIFSALLFCANHISAQRFSDYFCDRTLRIDYIFAAKRNPWYVMISRCRWFREEVCRVWDEVYEESNGFVNTSYVLDGIVQNYKDEIDEDKKIWKRSKDHKKYAILTRDWVKDHIDWLNTHYDLEYEKSKWLNP